MAELKHTKTKDWYSVEEYNEILAASEVRVEYLNGQIRYMAGGSINHSRLSSRILNQLMNSFSDKGKCEAFSSDLKVHIEKKNSYVLPDVTVVCGKIETSENDKNAVTNPSLIIEVLSESTKNYDYIQKFGLYRSIASLNEYVLIHQSEAKVEFFTKKEGIDIWQIKTYTEEDKILYFESVDTTISIAELYKDLEL